jgi:hypothetical protein
MAATTTSHPTNASKAGALVRSALSCALDLPRRWPLWLAPVLFPVAIAPALISLQAVVFRIERHVETSI